MQAADALDAVLADDPTRTGLLTKVRRMAASSRPVNRAVSSPCATPRRPIRTAITCARSTHVMRAFDAERGPLAPPPLSAQLMQPGLLAF